MTKFTQAIFYVALTASLFGAQDSIWLRDFFTKTPKVFSTTNFQQAGYQSFFYEGVDYGEKPTRLYAYYKTPAGKAPKDGWPAVVLVHGGGGTAYTAWIDKWVKKGYAAIAMDLEGHLPDTRRAHDKRPTHEHSGPVRANVFNDINKPVEEQWMYHAVSGVVLAGNLLKSFDEVNVDMIGIHGISWGAIIALDVMGIYPDFKFGVAVYGCGYIPGSDSIMVPGYAAEGLEGVKKKRELWDPAAYLAKIRTPILWVNSTTDEHFPLDIFQKSAKASGGESYLRIKPGMYHGHQPAWNVRDIYRFADNVLETGKHALKPGRPEKKGKLWICAIDQEAKPNKVEVCYTADDGKWSERKWKTIPAVITEKRIEAELPEGTKVFFFNIYDAEKVLYSSEHVVLD